MAQATTPTLDIIIFAIEYHELLKLRATDQLTSFVSALTHSSNLVTFVFESDSIGPWILGSGITDLMTQTNLFFCLLDLSRFLAFLLLLHTTLQLKSGPLGEPILFLNILESVLFILEMSF
ncbi:hypothetical protein V8G54_019474 [Vigna mungo]|uniref:Uncharacterized protein n=1 Tax=Vigna mungo TaxID=3915 RepID=A0AAQ3ND71_VIGMU